MAIDSDESSDVENLAELLELLERALASADNLKLSMIAIHVQTAVESLRIRMVSIQSSKSQ